jgi:DNA-binding NarL/FixJ family response regulator
LGTVLLIQASVSTNIWVLIRNVPPLMRDVIQYSISTQSDMEVLGEENVGASSALGRITAPDVVILGTTQAEHMENAAEVLLRWPRTQVLMIEVDGRVSALYELTLRKSLLGEMSPAELVDAIRVSVERNRAASIWGTERSH